MTALTPQQMRALADEVIAWIGYARLEDGPLENVAAALRAAADQLEAVQAVLAEASDTFAAAYDREREHGRGPQAVGLEGAPLALSVQRALDLLRAKATANIERLTAGTAPQGKATTGSRAIPSVRDMTPGAVFTALHKDSGECGGVKHRWFVFWSKGYGNAVYNDEGQRWSADSIDFTTVCNYTAPQEDRDDPYEGQDWDWSNPR